MYRLAKPVACALLMFAAVPAVHSAVCHVTTAGNSTNTGDSWASSYDLQTALGNASCTEIWVAAGTYMPTTDTDRTISFNVKPNVAVYGGFVGTETTRDARDSATNTTILSGDIGTASDASDNSFHVVMMDGTTPAGNIMSSTSLDGFTITAGNANIFPDFSGGGLYCNGQGSNHACSPTLNNLVFSGNSASNGGAIFDDASNAGVSSPALSNVTFSGNSVSDSGSSGGAMYNYGANGGISSPTLTDVTFSGNFSEAFGGAMYNNGDNDGTSSPVLTNVIFRNNSAAVGGAVFNDGYAGTGGLILTDVTFSGNSATGSGGAMYNYCYGCTGSPMLTNVTFSGNSGYSGGAMFNENGSPTLTNVTFSGNSASYSGGAMFNDNGSPALTNVILWHDSLSGTGGGGAEIFNANSTPVIDHSIVQGSGGSASWDNGLGIDGGGNLDADPKLGALANNGGFTSTLLPDADGAAIDMGVCHVDDPKVSTVDQRGMVRPQPYPNGACDIGSVEAGDVSDRIFANGFNGLSSG